MALRRVMLRLKLKICFHIFTILLCTHVVHSQPSQISLDFEDLTQIESIGGVANGSIEQVQGISGMGLSLANATSLCFPAQTFLGETQGTLQFWIKDISQNGGIWEVNSIGTNKKWGAYRLNDPKSEPVSDTLNFELQTSSSNITRSTRNWTSNSSWHFVVFTWQQGSARTEFTLYLDTISGAKPNLLGKVALTQDSMLCFGNYSNKGSSHPIIDQLSTYSYVRSLNQISNDFNELFTGCPSWPYIWRNPINGADVDHNGILNKYDTLRILSAIASGEVFDFMNCPNDSLPEYSYDTFADNILNLLDAETALAALNNTLPKEDKFELVKLSKITQGDANADGNLTAEDLQIILQNLTKTVEIFTNGDINGDGLVDNLDLLVARKYFSSSEDPSLLLPSFIIKRPLTAQ